MSRPARNYSGEEVLALRHVPWEGIGAFAEGLEARGLTWRYVDRFAGEPLPDLAQARTVIVMGGPMGAYEGESYPFLREEIESLRESVSVGVPTLGVCLGSQLLAAALGAEVYPNPEGKEIGWGPIYPVGGAGQDPIFSKFSTEEAVLHWHGDVFELPEGATPLASSPITTNQAFRWGSSAWGLLFHVEAGPELIRDWLAEPTMSSEAAGLDPALPQKIMEEAPLQEERLTGLREAVLEVFMGSCTDTARSKG